MLNSLKILSNSVKSLAKRLRKLKRFNQNSLPFEFLAKNSTNFNFKKSKIPHHTHPLRSTISPFSPHLLPSTTTTASTSCILRMILHNKKESKTLKAKTETISLPLSCCLRFSIMLYFLSFLSFSPFSFLISLARLLGMFANKQAEETPFSPSHFNDFLVFVIFSLFLPIFVILSIYYSFSQFKCLTARC